jgi:hypothetical protein
MGKRTVLYVSPGSRNGWDVKRQDAERASKHFDNKTDAVAFAKQLAKGSGPSQLKIQKQDGKFQTEYTYKKDPYPPKG